jgi:hypothetical protein
MASANGTALARTTGSRRNRTVSAKDTSGGASCAENSATIEWAPPDKTARSEGDTDMSTRMLLCTTGRWSWQSSMSYETLSSNESGTPSPWPGR